MHPEISLNSTPHAHGGILPQEITIAGSNWFNRASHYPIFSITWYRHRSVAMLVLTCTICALAAVFLSVHTLTPMEGWFGAISLATIVVAPLLLACLLGPGLAVIVRRLELPRHLESTAIAVALLAGLATSAGLGDALAQHYESPSFDSSTGVLTTRNLPTFKSELALVWGTTSFEANADIDKKYRPDYLRSKSAPALAQERWANLKKNFDELGYTQQEDSASDAVTYLKKRPGKSENIGPYVAALLALLYMCWLGGVFDMVAFLRQRSHIVDVLQREELKRAQSARNAAELRLSVLAAQIEPHFLFNTLASVRSAIATDPQRAEQIVDHMVGFLRSTIPQMRDDVSSITVNLAGQMQSARSYLALMHERIPRLQFSVDSEPGLEAAQLPPLMLISLVENAVKHGVEPKIGTARIIVQARRVDVGGASHLEVSVSDDGVGFGNATSGGGIGLSNIQERLRTLFGSRASLTLKALPAGGVAAILRLPLSFAE